MLFRSMIGQEKTDPLLIQAYLQAIFLNIKRNILENRGRRDIVDQAVCYMKEHYHEDLTIEKLAKMLYVNPTYLSRLFKKKMQMGPMQYLIQVRVREAQKLLSKTEIGVNDIAGKVGIPDSKYFSRIFKKVTGSTPSAYRKTSKNSPLFSQ